MDEYIMEGVPESEHLGAAWHVYYLYVIYFFFIRKMFLWILFYYLI